MIKFKAIPNNYSKYLFRASVLQGCVGSDCPALAHLGKTVLSAVWVLYFNKNCKIENTPAQPVIYLWSRLYF